MIELELDGLRRQAGSWHKVLKVERGPQTVIITVVRGLSLFEQPSVVTDDFQLKRSPEIEAFLASPEFQRKLFLPSNRGIVLVDVAGYSRYDTQAQSAILTMFYESLQLAELSNDLFSGEPSIDQIVPTGDGCFIVFKPEVNDRVFNSVFSIHASFCAQQNRLLKKLRSEPTSEVLGIRLACHLGDVDFIVDAAGNRNAYGTGLNETARILQYGRATLKKRLGGQDPVSVAFYGLELHSQATALTGYFQRLPGVTARLMDLETVATKHNLPLVLRCVTDLPKHILVPFDSPIPGQKAGL
jgi:hypothetical protein